MTDAAPGAPEHAHNDSRPWAWLAARGAWLTDRRQGLAADELPSRLLLVVLGREHYVERRRRYPIASWRDLGRVLRHELASAPQTTLAVFGPPAADGREVTFYELRPGALEAAGEALFVLPESLLVAATLEPGTVGDVGRDGLRYFVAPTGVSQPAAGTVASPELFVLASGSDASRGVVGIDGAGARRRLLEGLRRLPGRHWLRLLRPSAVPSFDLDWKRLALWAGLGIGGYLLLASAYLTLTTALRERELERLGPEVQSLLDAQHAVDALQAERVGIAGLLEAQPATYRAWRVVALAWSKGAQLSALSLNEGQLTLRGSAPSATDVLGLIAAEGGVADARFSAPVRSTGDGAEEFVVTMQLEPDRG